MISDVDLDRILTVWFADGGDDRAPEADVDAALAIVATTPQGRSWRAWLGDAPVRRPRWLLVAAALLLLAIGVAIGIGALLRPPTPPVPPEPPAMVEPVSSPVALVRQQIEDWPVQVSIPESWTEIDPQCCDFRQFAGDEPIGHLSIGHESPYSSSVCDPACHAFVVPQTIPYDASKQIVALKAEVAGIAGTDAWTPLPPGVLPDVVDGAMIDTTGERSAGETWRRVYIVGLVDRNLVTFAFSQPVERFDQSLLDAILASVDLGHGPEYSDGDPIPVDAEAFSMDIPGSWQPPGQPELDGVKLSGVWRFGEGEVLVSIGDEDGTLGWCERECNRLTGLTSLEALEAAIRGHQPLGVSIDATLGGAPARAFGTDVPHLRRYRVAMHDGRPVVIRIDAGSWDVASTIPARLFDSFQFADPATGPEAQVLTDPEGRFEIGLSDVWKQVERDGPFLADLNGQRLVVRVGDDEGRVTRCETPANVWEQCDEVTVSSLEELAAAVTPIEGEPGLDTPSFRRDSGTLDGEPSVVLHITGYEPVAQGGQSIVYVVAMHDGRPYVLRFWTGDEGGLRDVESVIAGFRFTDRGP